MVLIFPPSNEYADAALWPEYTSGGGDTWCPLPPTVKKYTNAYVLIGSQVLLGMKKRGFGAGKYNGFGGKVQENESSLDAAIRELKEEAGVSASLEHAGILLFVNEGNEYSHHIDLYRADSFSGEITESEEMRPEWFEVDASTGDGKPVPFDRMWEDDRHWFPLLLEKRFFIGRADFREVSEGTFVPSRYWFCARP